MPVALIVLPASLRVGVLSTVLHTYVLIIHTYVLI